MSDDLSVLVVSNEYPNPPIDGHKVRILNLLKQIPQGYKFDFMGFGDEISTQDHERFRSGLGPACKAVELIPASTLERVDSLSQIGRLKNILFPDVMTIGAPYYSKELERRIRTRLSSDRYQLVFFGGLNIFRHIDPSTSTVPYLVDIVDCPSLLTWSYVKQERRPFRALKRRLAHTWAVRYEKIHAAKIPNIVMITSVDAEWIERNCPDSRIWVISNGVDAKQFDRGDSPHRSGAALLFTGVMDYPPNNTAMLHFIKETFPRIRKENPNVTLTIAGRNPTNELVSMAASTAGVKVTGFVEDLRKYFEAATVYVSPLLSGAGLKNKVLEAWSMTLPVVASSVSCSGMAAADNRNLLIADSPSEFASKVLAVLSDANLRERLSVEGRATVERDYSWQSRGAMLGSVFEAILSKKPISPGIYLSA